MEFWNSYLHSALNKLNMYIIEGLIELRLY